MNLGENSVGDMRGDKKEEGMGNFINTFHMSENLRNKFNEEISKGVICALIC